MRALVALVLLCGVAFGQDGARLTIASDPQGAIVSLSAKDPKNSQILGKTPLTVELKAGEEMRIAHQFASAPRPRPRQESRGGFWNELKRKLGGS